MPRNKTDKTLDPARSAASLPPNSLDQLHELLTCIRHKNSSVRLGKRSIDTLAVMLGAPRQTAVYSISQLASAHAINPSTLTRLAKSLGFDGFSAFQSLFRDHIAQSGHFYTDRIDHLRETTRQDASAYSVANRVGQDEIDNISSMLSGLEIAKLESAVQLLVKAKRIRTQGQRLSYPVANFVSYSLGMLRQDVSMLATAGHGLAHSLAHLKKGDVLFVVGSTPYTNNTVLVSRTARNLGVKLISLTDSHASPLASLADYSFVAPTGGIFVNSSMASWFVFSEILVSMVAEELGAKTDEAIKQREDLINQMQVEL